jgi:4-deoxy-L-threo-5-hexosulose-uronate ketol-isomerase
MKTNYQLRYAAHPEDAKSYDTQRLRRDFLIEKLFAPDEVNMVYSMYDRMVVGGAMPVNEPLHLEAIDPLKQPVFLCRRELGIFNVGGKGKVKVGDTVLNLITKKRFTSVPVNVRSILKVIMLPNPQSFISTRLRHTVTIPIKR